MKPLLESFNQKAETLLDSPLAKKVLLGELKCSFSWKAGEGIEVSSPDYEKNDLDAFILTLRLFVQNNEGISLYNLQHAYDASTVSQDLKDAVTRAHADLNAFLDSRMIFQWPDGAQTYREHFETVMYGDLAHMNATKAELFRKWVSDPFISHHVWTLFLMVVQNLLATISYVRVVNQKTLEEIH